MSARIRADELLLIHGRDVGWPEVRLAALEEPMP